MKKILLVIVFSTVSVFANLLSSITNFVDKNNSYQVSIGSSYVNINSSDLMHNAVDLNLRIGKYLKNDYLARLELEKNIMPYGDAPSFSQVLFNIERYFNMENKTQRYLFAGIGYEWISSKGDNSALMDIGAGARYNYDNALMPFIEFRALRKFANSDNYYSTMLGITYKFGGIKFVDRDKDHDGVLDSKDKCPNTPLGVYVNKNGCPDIDRDGVPDYLDKCAVTPQGVEVDDYGCPYDSDIDGIPDYKDKCPDTIAGIKIDDYGCAIDSDKDGVPDYKDKCEKTPLGSVVNKDGCMIKYNFNITFPNNQAVLTADAQIKVSKFFTFLENHPKVKAVIIGYTDNVGPIDYNIKLSKRRAKVVYDRLIKLGISKDRLSYKGYGPMDPIVSNTTVEGRSKNRRVVAKLIYK